MTFPTTIGWTDVAGGISAFLTGGVLLILAASVALRFVRPLARAIFSLVGGRR